MAEERRNALTPGTEVEGYRIESILGAGGFGVTYRATETLLNRSVAIKEFLPAGMVVRETDGISLAPIGSTEAGEFEWGMDRFRQEAQTLVAFRHPNIVTVFRYFETNGTGYLVMEFVEGRTLAQLLRPDNVLDEDEIREILDPLLNGLEAVHDKGFLHRDIKPANIFLRKDGSPVLIDFGAARLAMGQHSKSLTSVVSAGYAPYEQYDSSANQGAWTDIYALGGVLYRCVTGRAPAEAPARVTAVFGGNEDPMPTAAQAAKTRCSTTLLGAIDDALSIREADRPQTVAAFRSSLNSGERQQTGAATDASQADTAEKGDQPTLLAGDVTRSAGRAAASKRTSPKVAVPIALVLLGAVGVGVWTPIAESEEMDACLGIARQLDAAIGKKDLTLARQRLNAARAGGCSKEMLADLYSKTQGLAARLAAEAERKRQEAARQALRTRIASRFRSICIAEKRVSNMECKCRARIFEENVPIELLVLLRDQLKVFEDKKLSGSAKSAKIKKLKEAFGIERYREIERDLDKKVKTDCGIDEKRKKQEEEERRKAAAEAERKRQEAEQKRLAEERRKAAIETDQEKFRSVYRKACADYSRIKKKECGCHIELTISSFSPKHLRIFTELIKLTTKSKRKEISEKKFFAEMRILRSKYGKPEFEKFVKSLKSLPGKFKEMCGVDLKKRKAKQQ